MSRVLPFVSPAQSSIAAPRPPPSDRAVLRQLVADLEVLVVAYPSAVAVLADAAQRFVAPIRAQRPIRRAPRSTQRARR